MFSINVSGEAGHKIDCWLAIARQEKIVNLKGLSGYNPPRIMRETCTVFSGSTLAPGCQNWLFYNYLPDKSISAPSKEEKKKMAISC